MYGNAAGALFLNGIERVFTTGRTVRFVFDVGAFAKKVVVRRRGRGRFPMLQRPLPLGAIDIPAVEGTGSLLRGLDGLLVVGNGYRRQQPDQGHDNHDFKKGESGSL